MPVSTLPPYCTTSGLIKLWGPGPTSENGDLQFALPSLAVRFSWDNEPTTKLYIESAPSVILLRLPGLPLPADLQMIMSFSLCNSSKAIAKSEN